MIIGNREFNTENSIYIMGILNVTPDSFSDGGSYKGLDDVLQKAGRMIAEGATVIDVGGESTRPGYNMISCEEEIGRVVPAIEAIKREYDIPVSLDTYKAPVAKAGIMAGADMINDIWGLKYDADMKKVIAKAKVACCLMHNRNEIFTVNGDAGNPEQQFVKTVLTEIAESIDLAIEAGISKDKIMIDPGIGFMKTYEQNLCLIKNLSRMRELNYPVLLGTSRKSVIGNTLMLPVEERLEGTLATSVIGAMAGCSFIRVHDVKENVRAVQMTAAVMNVSLMSEEHNAE